MFTSCQTDGPFAFGVVNVSDVVGLDNKFLFHFCGASRSGLNPHLGQAVPKPPTSLPLSKPHCGQLIIILPFFQSLISVSPLFFSFLDSLSW
jgi:hypothetical protein